MFSICSDCADHQFQQEIEHCAKYLTRLLGELEMTMRCRFATFHECLCWQQFKVNSKAFDFAVVYVYEEYIQQEQRWLRQPRNKRTAASSHEQRNDTVIVAHSASLWPLLSFCHTQPAWVHTHTRRAYKELPHTHTHTQHSSTPTEDKAAQRVVLSLHSCSSLAYIIIFCFAAALAVDLYTLWICESKQRAQNDDIIWRVQYLCTTRQSWQFTMLSLFLSEPVKLILDALFAVKTLSYVGGMFQ